MGPEATMAIIGGLLLLLWWRQSGPPKATTPGEREQRDYWRPRAESAAQARDEAEWDNQRVRVALSEAQAHIEALEKELAAQKIAVQRAERESGHGGQRRIEELEAESRRLRRRLGDAVDVALALAASGRRALDRHQADATRVNGRGLPDLTINVGPIATSRDEIERLERSLPET